MLRRLSLTIVIALIACGLIYYPSFNNIYHPIRYVNTFYRNLLDIQDRNSSAIFVNWNAPFYSGGGYCHEAINIVKSLYYISHPIQKEKMIKLLYSKLRKIRKEDDEYKYNEDFIKSIYKSPSILTNNVDNPKVWLKITQHGDSYNYDFVNGLSVTESTFLSNLMTSINAEAEITKKIIICHSEPGAWSVPSPRYHTTKCPVSNPNYYTIGRTMFETDRLPDGWNERINKLDEIWVPSEFHRDIFIEGGVEEDKIYILPEPIDTLYFDPKKTEPLDISNYIQTSFGRKFEVTNLKKMFKFLSIFKWEKRKAFDVLLKGYFEEFINMDGVVLVILTNPYHLNSDDQLHDSISPFAYPIQLIADEVLQNLNAVSDTTFTYEDLPPVILLKNNLPQTKMPPLYKSADCFVIPSRGEGWGMPHMEAMAMELPVIATNFSGNLAFQNENNSFLIKVEKLIEITDGAFKGHKWAQPDINHFKELLRNVYSMTVKKRRTIGTTARKSILKYSIQDFGNNFIIEHIKRINNNQYNENE